MAFVTSVLLINKLSKTVEGSSHSDQLPQFMVMVFTPAGDAELTFEKVVACLRCCTYDPILSNPKRRGPTSTSISGPPDDNNASIYLYRNFSCCDRELLRSRSSVAYPLCCIWGENLCVSLALAQGNHITSSATPPNGPSEITHSIHHLSSPSPLFTLVAKFPHSLYCIGSQIAALIFW